MFLSGLQHFKVITDHNPLIPILNSHRLDEIDNRLQRLRAKLMAFNFTAVWCKGSTNKAPDALSRSPVLEPCHEDALAECDEENRPDLSISELRALYGEGESESIRLQELRSQAAQDEEYQQLKEVILNGFPNHRGELNESCKRYWQVRHSLTIDEDLIVFGCRLLIPRQMRKSVLNQLHEAHQGAVRTKQRARLTVYWPGIDNDIDSTVLSCTQCQDHLPSNTKEPMISKPKPARPFQEIAADFCHHAGRNYLVLVDCYTDWPTIVPMGKDISSAHLIAAVRELFSRTAVPDTFWSDGGPQFTSKQFHQFSATWGFRHQVSSPYYPQSNGKAKATVKSMKKIIRASWNGRHLEEEKLCRALLQYRNTPSTKDGQSPAQKLYGHPIQDILPAHGRSFAPEWQHSMDKVEHKTRATLEKASSYYNQRAHSLPDIHKGTHVAVQNPKTKLWDTYGVVISIGPHRQYHVKTASGNVLKRNRRFLRRRIPASIFQSETNMGTTQDQPLSCSSPPPSSQHLQPRRSTRVRGPPHRLIADPSWN